MHYRNEIVGMNCMHRIHLTINIIDPIKKSGNKLLLPLNHIFTQTQTTNIYRNISQIEKITNTTNVHSTTITKYNLPTKFKTQNTSTRVHDPKMIQTKNTYLPAPSQMK